MSLEKRAEIMSEVEEMQRRTGIAQWKLAGYAGIAKRTWQEWKTRAGVKTGHVNNFKKGYYLTPEEERAIGKYYRENMGRGYRALCWEMVDENIAFVSPCSVYNVIKRLGLTQKGKDVSEPEKGGFVQPRAVNEQWHIDFSYIKIGGNFYYFVCVLDGFSRKILAWRLCETMEGVNAAIVVTEAHEKYPDAHPRIISDNGKQFLSKDFKELLTLLEFGHTFTSPFHPQSNGKVERFNRTFKEEHVYQTAYTSADDARYRMSMWIAFYNSVRLHSALHYLTPDDVFFGRTERRLAERREKLHTAFIKRRDFWKNQVSMS